MLCSHLSNGLLYFDNCLSFVVMDMVFVVEFFGAIMSIRFSCSTWVKLFSSDWLLWYSSFVHNEVQVSSSVVFIVELFGEGECVVVGGINDDINGVFECKG